MKLSALGESEVIAVLTEMVVASQSGPDNATPHGFRLRVDAGDDTAAWNPGRGTELFTTDTIVEGVHFTLSTASWHDLGWKIMAANVSDIAAMGGHPLYALVTLGLPPETEVDDLKSLYRGMLALGNRYGVRVVGGDVIRSRVVFITVALTGVTDSEPMLRSNARVNDRIAVTGSLGSAAGGLKVIRDGLANELAESLKAAHLRPDPCLSEGIALTNHGVKAAMDISDGLLEDLSKICRASGVAAKIDAAKIPVLPALKEVFPNEYLDLALGGGEDYQLLFTAPSKLMDEMIRTLPSPAAVIGDVVEGDVGKVEAIDSQTGGVVEPSHGGWDHFR